VISKYDIDKEGLDLGSKLFTPSMALVAPSIMSTTTCLRLDEVRNKQAEFRRCFFSEPPSRVSHELKEEASSLTSETLETKQKVLLLKGAREQYTLVADHTVPSILHPGEILVKVCYP
jgi:hypothetical protein